MVQTWEDYLVCESAGKLANYLVGWWVSPMAAK